ncbi:MAG: CDP-diacylglycerol--glycerol-3-phosphate 3-phosphatidyltransferase [Bacilli bacterium]|nr:CDP-diacylglycerol--glycerol-3-phosphate 3-phosphatidyltransferase [Bacilli bacterium]MBN2877425.1 CDP-diacylglycerol--glycerol-3-phosphate 3-phosphatidyltransferase [Bacilli bacterium]
MNLPNKLTMVRIFIIPLIVIIYLLQNAINWNFLVIIGILFILASVTDYLDGYIARKRDIVTTFGKFIDPLADKLLVLGTLLMLSDYYANNFTGLTMWMPFWVVLIILSRELIVTSIRLVAVGEGIILHASKWGKYKTAFTMMTLAYYFFIMPMDVLWINIIGVVFVSISVLLTIGSGVDYFLKNKDLILKSY